MAYEAGRDGLPVSVLVMLEQFLRFFPGLSGFRDVGEPEGPFVQEDRKPLLLWRFTQAAPGTRVYFSSRRGGVSEPPFESLNLGFHVGDDLENVKINRQILCSALGLDHSRITSPRQRHTAAVAAANGKDGIGSGAFSEESAFDPCDGLVTAMPNVPILLHYADCVPVVLTAGSAPGGPVVGVVHAGRKGLMEGVISNAVDLAAGKAGAAPSSIVAAIGPCIGPCCYRVDKDIAAAFEKRLGAGYAKDGYLDLRRAARDELASGKIRPGNIYSLDICTSCNDDFYSYRRDGVTGRHGAIGWIA